MPSLYARYFKKIRYQVLPNSRGYLYKAYKLEQELEPGIYKLRDAKREYSLVALPTVPFYELATNQEALSQDNIAFRFSYMYSLGIADGRKLLGAISHESLHVLSGVRSQVLHVAHPVIQVALRDRIAQHKAMELMDQRTTLVDGLPEEVTPQLEAFGLALENVVLRDVTFPKQIQQILAQKLEAELSAETELTKARTQVAAARALKNVAKLMSEDPQLRYLQYLDTLQKLSEKGRHTFVMGELPHEVKP